MNLFETQTKEFARVLGHHNNEYYIKNNFKLYKNIRQMKDKAVL
jgi:hypothetical protein